MDLSEVSDETSPRHPWELSRFRFFADQLKRSGALRGAKEVLDAGAGDAWFSRMLLLEAEATTHFTCWDAAYTPDSPHRLGTALTGRIDLTTSRPEIKVDLLLALDFLEHVEDDEGVLTTLVRENLRPGGMAFVSVPAWQSLMTSHDERLRHYRRYSPSRLSALLATAGLTIASSGGAFHSLLLPRAMTKVREQWLPQTVAKEHAPLVWSKGPVTTGLVYGALRADNLFSQAAARFSLSVPGLTVWALCRKP